MLLALRLLMLSPTPWKKCARASTLCWKKWRTAGKYLAGGVSCWRNLEDSRSKRANNVEKTEKRLEIIDFHGERGHFRQFFQTSLEKCGATSTKNTIWKNGGENWKNTKILQKFRICNIAVQASPFSQAAVTTWRV